MRLEDALSELPVIAVLRGPGCELLVQTCQILIDCGIRAVELTCTTPGAQQALADVARRFGADAAVGLGTVSSVEQVRAAQEAQGSFVVSPGFDAAVIAEAHRCGLAALPGAFTPTEITTAARTGSAAVKIFPARALGPCGLSDLRGPFPDLRLVPSGGIDIEHADQWLSAGAAAIGVGGPLLREALTQPDPELARRAKQLVAVCRPFAGRW